MGPKRALNSLKTIPVLTVQTKNSKPSANHSVQMVLKTVETLQRVNDDNHPVNEDDEDPKQ